MRLLLSVMLLPAAFLGLPGLLFFGLCSFAISLLGLRLTAPIVFLLTPVFGLSLRLFAFLLIAG